MPSATIRPQGEMHSLHIEKLVYYVRSLMMIHIIRSEMSRIENSNWDICYIDINLISYYDLLFAI